MPATFVVLSPNNAAGHRKQTKGREIERLEEHIRELEEQLQRPSNPVSDGILVTAKTPNSQWIQAGPGKLREGIYTTGVQSEQSQWYGLLSNFYYISRLRSDLTIALQQPQSDDNIQPNSASQIFVSPTSSKPADSSLEETALSADLGASGSYLTPTQEDYFLSLFWESYHCTFQILDEGEFREHYRSLWKTSSSTRKPSPLVDIILAICMQYGLAFLPREVSSSEPKTVVDGNDATIAGRWYYHRSQMLLNSQLESPSMMTLQCQILAVKYLCNASYQNMAYSGLATAIRTAHLLGVHLEPPVDMPREQRELRKRMTKMMLAVRTIFVAFADKCGDIVTSNLGRGIYKDPQTLEECATFLESKMGVLRSFESQLPDGLKTKRKNGVPFSTDRAMLDIELYAPLWLQRQRLMFELLYHNLALNLYRPFICFPSTFVGSLVSPPETSAFSNTTPVTESHANSCIEHAMTITRMMHQILIGSEILSGMHEAFHFQWNATVSLIGFILAYPLSPLTPEVRENINNAIAVFETFGKHFAVGASAANVTRSLVAKADYLTERFHARLASLETPNTPDFLHSYLGTISVDNMDLSAQTQDFMELMNFPMSGTTDLGLSLDPFAGLEQFYSGSTNDAWVLDQN
ncbi:hypothetical protein ZTR_09977 [Talaromyces verruculosus]|nr:hypothetical protein ZTR_09977 [Talaromyces verruculosus]